MKTFVTRSVLGFCALYCFATASALAASIGLNLQGGGDPVSGTVSTSSNLGVTGIYQQVNWNNLMPSQVTGSAGMKETYTGPFVNSAGAATALQFVWTGGEAVNNWTNGPGGDDPDPAPEDSGPRDVTTAAAGNLFMGYAYSGGAPESFRFTGVPYSNYDVVLYVGKGTASVQTTTGATIFDVNGLPTDGTTTSYGFAQGQYLDTWTPAAFAGTSGATVGGNYIVIPGLTDASFILSFPTTEGSLEINAIQFVQAVPEPGTLALLGMAVPGLAMIRRLRRRA